MMISPIVSSPKKYDDCTTLPMRLYSARQELNRVILETYKNTSIENGDRILQLKGRVRDLIKEHKGCISRE